MRQEAYILVLPRESLPLARDREPLVRALDDGDQVYGVDDDAAFVRSCRGVEPLLAPLRSAYFEAGRFFLAEISNAARAGNMLPSFWTSLSGPEREAAA